MPFIPDLIIKSYGFFHTLYSIYLYLYPHLQRPDGTLYSKSNGNDNEFAILYL